MMLRKQWRQLRKSDSRQPKSVGWSPPLLKIVQNLAFGRTVISGSAQDGQQLLMMTKMTILGQNFLQLATECRH